MSSIEFLAQNYEQVSELIAGAIVRRVKPVDDELSESEAQKAYGTRWLNRMRDARAREIHTDQQQENLQPASTRLPQSGGTGTGETVIKKN